MFKVKSRDLNVRKQIVEELNIIETKQYQYVLTLDKDLVEEGKINFVFGKNDFDEIRKLVDTIILGQDEYITGENANGFKQLNIKDIEYFEALANDVFAVVGKERFLVPEKLYTLEEKLEDKNFVRTSKSFMVNILKIEYIKPLFNYKLELLMTNKDRIDVNRTYMKSFKARLKV